MMLSTYLPSLVNKIYNDYLSAHPPEINKWVFERNIVEVKLFAKEHKKLDICKATLFKVNQLWYVTCDNQLLQLKKWEKMEARICKKVKSSAKKPLI